MSNISDIVGYSFKDQALLKTALTHSSAGQKYNYQRLEFLGDRVLGLVIAHELYTRYPKEPEGHLAKRLAALVQGTFLARIARDAALGSHITFSAAEKAAGGAENDNILADVFESLIGAIYIDGGYNPCHDLIVRLWEPHFDEMKAPPQHPKTALQEWAQSHNLPLPIYEIVDQSGPDHAPVFKVRITLGGHAPVETEGASRQQAEKRAARKMLETIGA